MWLARRSGGEVLALHSCTYLCIWEEGENMLTCVEGVAVSVTVLGGKLRQLQPADTFSAAN